MYEMFVSCIVDEVRNQVQLLGHWHSSLAPSEIRALLYIASVLEHYRPRARFDRDSPSARSLLCCSCAFATTTLQSFILEDSRLKPTTNLCNGCSTYLCENTAWTSGKFANGHNQDCSPAAVGQAKATMRAQALYSIINMRCGLAWPTTMTKLRMETKRSVSSDLIPDPGGVHHLDHCSGNVLVYFSSTFHF